MTKKTKKPAKKNPSPIVDDWQGCYPSNWTGIILPEAMSHPAKYSSKLIRRIYDHAGAEGWIKPGDRVVDPFGGVGLGALDAMRKGLHWTGMELEPRFIELGGMSYPCPGFTAEWWESLQAEPEEKRKEIIQGLRSEHKLCPSCETALTPKPSKKKGKSPPTPQREPHTYRGNIPLWMNKFSSLPNLGTARLLQGDSRRLLSIIQEADLSISSPPFADILSRDRVDPNHRVQLARQSGISNAEFISPIDMERIGKRDQSYDHTPGQLADMDSKDFDLALSSPPYEGTGLDFKDNRMAEGDKVYHRPYMDQQTENYGRTVGQLGSMPSGDFDLSLSSPPYVSGGHHNDQTGAYNNNGGGQNQGKETAGYGPTPGQLGQMNPEGFDLSISSPPFLQSSGGTPEPKPGGTIDPALHKRHLAGNKAAGAYGQTDGQLSDMDDHDFDLSVSSPPYSPNIQVQKNSQSIDIEKQYKVYKESGGGQTLEAFQRTQLLHSQGYGDTPGNLANEEINSFWLAARAIVNQTFAALRPGGHAVWVTKRYVKNKEVVDFSSQWAQLCEAAGFRIIHWHRASLVHHKGTSITLEGEHIEHTTESKSFFRRVYERKGGHRIDWEDIICMVKD